MSKLFVSNGHSNAPILQFTAEASMMLYFYIRMSAERVNMYGDNPAYGNETKCLTIAWLNKNTNVAIIPCIPLCRQTVSGAAAITSAQDHEIAWNKCRDYVKELEEWQFLLDENNYEEVKMIWHHHVNMTAFASGGFSRDVEKYYNQEPDSDVPTFLHFTNYGHEKHFSLIMNIPTLDNFKLEELFKEQSELKGYFYDVVANANGNRTSNNFCFIYNQPKIQKIIQTQYFNSDEIVVNDNGVTILGPCLLESEVSALIERGQADKIIVNQLNEQIYTPFQTAVTTVIQSSNTNFPEILMEYADKTTLRSIYYQINQRVAPHSLSVQELMQSIMQTIQSLCIDGGDGGKKLASQYLAVVGQSTGVREIFI